jgi:hypothetical protein
MEGSYAKVGPRLAVESASDPLAALQSELRELIDACGLPLPAAPAHPFSELRAAVAARGAAASHEASRLSLLFSHAEKSGEALPLAALRACCGGLADAAATFTAAAQALAAAARPAPAAAGAAVFSGDVFKQDLRAACGALLRALAGAAAAAAAGGAEQLPAAAAAAAAARLLPEVGRVGVCAEALRRLPVSPSAAVRRRLLQAGLLVKRSAADLRAETGTAAGGRGGGGGGAGAAGAQLAGALLVDAACALLQAVAKLVAAALDAVDRVAEAAATGEGGASLDAVALALAPLSDGVVDLAAAASDCYEELAGGGDLEEEKEEEEEEEEGEEGGGGGRLGGAGGGGGGASAVDTTAETEDPPLEAASEAPPAPAPTPASRWGAAAEQLGSLLGAMAPAAAGLAAAAEAAAGRLADEGARAAARAALRGAAEGVAASCAAFNATLAAPPPF